MPDVQTKDNVKLHYRVIGSGDQDVVLVHGWMVSGAVWDDLIEALDGSGLRLIVPDLRGAGESEDADDYSLTRYAEDVFAVADDAGADSFALVGHSMGGAVAQLAAAEQPERVERLVVMCSVPASGMELPDEAHELFINSGENRQDQEAILDMACLDLDDADKERLLDDAGTIAADCIRRSYEAWTGGGFADRLSEITAPTLVVGTDDPFLPPEFLNQAIVEPIADARFTHIPGAGHYVQVERTDEAAANLREFVGGS